MIIGQIMLIDGTLINRFDGEITTFAVNGEMAPITWYRQTFSDGRRLDINRNFVATISWDNIVETDK